MKEEAKLTITLDTQHGREVSLNWFHKEDKVKFQWEEYHCGDRDAEETAEITLGELFELLTINKTHEVQLKIIADRELDKRMEHLREVCKRLQGETYRLAGIEKEHTALLKAIDKASKDVTNV